LLKMVSVARLDRRRQYECYQATNSSRIEVG
jgi:hypothetical protein